ncbi:MAG: hypothetical protein NT039_02235 [Candidatus Berkelbacteria bacterium]|nr:hypothetical protein [Candidatus Berkelbacteria bacterium]
MKILHLNQEKKWIPVEEKHYNDELELQDLLVQDVNTLPFEEIGYDSPFVTIGKEITLQNGSLDILAVSPEGQIALIETKLNKNPEAKRTVVGQVLGYASYLWNKSYQDIEDCFKKFKATEKINFNGSLADYVKENIADANFSQVDFKEGIEKRLRLGSFTLLIVVDEISEELKNIANYLNERTGQEIDFYLAEMELIGDKDEQFLIPRLVNPPRKNIAVAGSKTSDKFDRTPINREDFLQILTPVGKNFANRLLDEFEESPDFNILWRVSGFAISIQVNKDLVKNSNYSNNFSFLFFKGMGAKYQNDERLQFWYPESAYRDIEKLRPRIEEYLKFCRSLKGYDEKNDIKDLSVFNNEKIWQLVWFIKKTAKNLKKE